jgi:hypothetical protein
VVIEVKSLPVVMFPPVVKSLLVYPEFLVLLEVIDIIEVIDNLEVIVVIVVKFLIGVIGIRYLTYLLLGKS